MYAVHHGARDASRTATRLLCGFYLQADFAVRIFTTFFQRQRRRQRNGYNFTAKRGRVRRGQIRTRRHKSLLLSAARALRRSNFTVPWCLEYGIFCHYTWQAPGGRHSAVIFHDNTYQQAGEATSTALFLLIWFCERFTFCPLRTSASFLISLHACVLENLSRSEFTDGLYSGGSATGIA